MNTKNKKVKVIVGITRSDFNGPESIPMVTLVGGAEFGDTIWETNIAGWNISIFNRKYIFNPGPFSMLVYRSVFRDHASFLLRPIFSWQVSATIRIKVSFRMMNQLVNDQFVRSRMFQSQLDQGFRVFFAWFSFHCRQLRHARRQRRGDEAQSGDSGF